jgi:hypothetical protein
MVGDYGASKYFAGRLDGNPENGYNISLRSEGDVLPAKLATKNGREYKPQNGTGVAWILE